MKPSIMDIIVAASEAFDIEGYRIIGRDRARQICRPRFAVCIIATRHGYSLPQIGRVLSGRDHTSIINGVHRAIEFSETDPDFRDRLAEAEERLASKAQQKCTMCGQTLPFSLGWGAGICHHHSARLG